MYGSSRTRFPVPPRAKNTPDVMILIRGERTVLIALEAKVFDNPAREQMAAQMLAQREIVEYLQRELALRRGLSRGVVAREAREQRRAARVSGDHVGGIAPGVPERPG